ncbi:glycosyltransferase family protein [Stutzerimonas stutzeri]|uniref:Glycosyltransferase family 1 protein n=1 Tax=Stutzerimonas stutzeri TaxID=316 RepID=A0ABD4XY54_STUST|nr:glycosyltransferase family 1 protein [Stutzerimonas stutzeri]MDH0687612.1 glycosyltransferase family 1 protein [Stutzerimonas stutzeri]
MSASRKKRILICGAPDLNYIDGSSVWSQTITLALAAVKGVSVDFIAKSTPERLELYEPLKSSPNVNIIDGVTSTLWEGKKHRRLTMPMMAELAVALDNRESYDVVVVRGREIADTLLNYPALLARCWLYLTDVEQDSTKYTQLEVANFVKLAHGCAKILCQSSGFVQLWRAIVPALHESKLVVYSPVIQDIKSAIKPIKNRPARAIYAGKYKAEWMTLEMARVWPELLAQLPNAELVMIGDKIHSDPKQINYVDTMRGLLESTRGLHWLGPMPRKDVQNQLLNCRVGLSWRAESMDSTLEYSTKLLEYGGAGCAAIINRNALHESLVGSDYPFFANNLDEFRSKLRIALTNDDLAQTAADRLKALALEHTFSKRVELLSTWLDEAPAVTKSAPNKVKVVVAGHDLKFFNKIITSLRSDIFEVRCDVWSGHNKHNEKNSYELLDWADVIHCEWCLGNLNWYSKRKKPHQRLVARFHAQEMKLPYMTSSNWDAIDHVTFVSEHTRRIAFSFYPELSFNKTSVVSNYLDENSFVPLKKTGEALFTLGMIGYSPKSKRLDRAINLLESLLQLDQRYCLRVKGSNPFTYSWLLKREEETSYYRNLMARINESPLLRYRVIFDPPGDDVNKWLSMIGHILSPSDAESFHMAVGEGMLAGAVPIIWNWDGALDVWPKDAVFCDESAAAKAVLDLDLDNWMLKSEASRRFVLDRHSSEQTIKSWHNILLRGSPYV